MTALKAPRRQTLQFGPDALNSATLPPHYYFDPAIFAAERENIFLKTWQYVGLREDVPKPGDYFTAEIQDQKIFVTRGKDGRLRAFHNVCMHRGHILVEGKGSKAIFTCPFHAWSYDATGALKAAGNAENVQGFRHEDFSLAEIRVEEFGPMVFVNLSDEGPALADMAGGLLTSFRTAIPHFDDLKFVRTDRWEVAANWKFQPDGLECYHCPVIHPQLMGSDDGYVQTSWISEEDTYWQVHIIKGNYDLMDHHKEKLLYDMGNQEIRDVYVWYLWPNTIFVTHQGPPNLKILHSQSLGPERSRRDIINLCLNNPPTATDLGHMDNYSFGVFPQDKEAMEKQQLGVKCRGYQGGRLMVDAEHSWRSEHGTHHFDNLVWVALNGARYG